MPKVSVIIPTFNRARVVGQAVESVLDQDYRDFELIVVDDGSTDDTAIRLAQFGDKIRILNIDHSGVSVARNRGLASAKGELVAFLDSDDYWLPEKLTVQTNFFDEHPGALICQTEEIWIRNGRRVNPGFRHQKPSGHVFIPSLELCLVSPSAVMMRKTLFDLVGIFDETLPACEDYDLWLRVSAGFPVYLIDRPLIVKTGGHADQLSRTTKGLDQYRVRALEKIIHSGMLTLEQKKAARLQLVQKARVYGWGCRKRGREEEANHFLGLADRHDPTNDIGGEEDDLDT